MLAIAAVNCFHIKSAADEQFLVSVDFRPLLIALTSQTSVFQIVGVSLRREIVLKFSLILSLQLTWLV